MSYKKRLNICDLSYLNDNEYFSKLKYSFTASICISMGHLIPWTENCYIETTFGDFYLILIEINWYFLHSLGY